MHCLDIEGMQTLLGNVNSIGTPGTPLQMKNVAQDQAVSWGNLPFLKILPLVATGVKEIPPFEEIPMEM